MNFFRDVSIPAVVAGFVAVLVGFTSSAVIVFQAAQALGAGRAETASWMFALGIGMGATSIVLSLWYKVPVLTAWSTPGAALLITSGAGVSLADATGAFIVSAVLISIAGYSGVFARVMDRIPAGIASAMLAGVLLRFGLDAFRSLSTALWMVLAMLASYLVARQFKPRYAVLTALAAGVAVALFDGRIAFSDMRWAVATPVWVTPTFSWQTIIGIALPLFLVTMASQNAPGVAAQRAAGYAPPLSPIIGATGIATLVLAPFGGYALNLAAITAAICMGREAHEDPARRYTAAVCAGIFYVIVGIFGASVAALFAAFPKELILAIAGIALLGTIGNGLAAALKDEGEREAALMTFLVTASGVTIAGVGSPFWGLVAGVVTMAATRLKV